MKKRFLIFPLVLLAACSLPTEVLKPALPQAKQFSPLTGDGAPVTLIPLVTGRRQIPRCIAVGEMPCYHFVDLVHVAYLVKHPKGNFLIDASWSRDARHDLASMPLVNRAALEYQVLGNLGDRLAARGNPALDFVLLTHIHPDHTSGLTDLQHPVVMLAEAEGDFVAAALPENPVVMKRHFEHVDLKTFRFDGPPVENFAVSKDLFGDGAVVAVPLPGHTPGSIGIFLNHVNGRRLFFIGDTAWTLDGIRLPGHRPISTSQGVDFDTAQLSDSLQRIHELSLAHPDLLIVPAHDGDVLKEVQLLLRGGRPKK